MNFFFDGDAVSARQSQLKPPSEARAIDRSNPWLCRLERRDTVHHLLADARRLGNLGGVHEDRIQRGVMVIDLGDD